MKQCKSCFAFLDASDFYTHPHTRDGLTGTCKECLKEKQRLYRLDNLTEILEKDRQREHKQLDSEYRKAYGQRTNYRVQKEWQKRNPEKRKAHLKVYYAVKTGKLIRPDKCENCGAIGPVQAHHHDYSKPLDVEWICKTCHAQEHTRY